MTELPLSGRTIAIPETRELDVFSDMLEKRGASVLRCPLVGILDAPDPAPVLDWIRWFNGGGCENLVLLTGEGLRRLLACIEHHTPELRQEFVLRLERTWKITRGPKPARALRELGLKPDLAAEEPTTTGVIRALRTLDLNGRTVGVQLYGAVPNPPLTGYLEEAGAVVRTVAPYIYADAAADSEVLALIDRLRAGTVHAIAFTSKAQVDRLFDVAQRAVRESDLRDGLVRTAVAAVGPIVRDELEGHGVKVALMPQDSWFLKPLTSLLVEHFQNSG